MLTEATTSSLDEKALERLPTAKAILSRKVWLPRLIYDCLPYFYLTAGFAAFFATLYISEWFWVLPHYCLFAAACVHLGLAVKGKRRLSADDGSRTPPAGD